MNATASILRLAATLIEKQPHLARGAFIDGTGCYCMVGAIDEAAVRLSFERFEPTALRMVKRHLPSDYAVIPAYNDNVATKDTAVAVLRAAAVTAEAEA